MAQTPIRIVDLYCAEQGRLAARDAGSKAVDLFTAASILLHERGLYAMFEHLKSKNQKVASALYTFLAEHGRVVLDGDEVDPEKIISAFRDDYAAAIHAKALMARCLDYAHAYAKAAKPPDAGPNAVAEVQHE